MTLTEFYKAINAYLDLEYPEACNVLECSLPAGVWEKIDHIAVRGFFCDATPQDAAGQMATVIRDAVQSESL